MEKHNAKAIYTNNKGKVKTTLSLISFKEDNAFIVYSPALDLSGYGKNISEAKSSFKIVLEEFFRYTINKQTLVNELKRLGWKVGGSKSNPKIKSAPDLATLIQNNQDLEKLLNEKDYSKFNKEVHIPELA